MTDGTVFLSAAWLIRVYVAGENVGSRTGEMEEVKILVEELEKAGNEDAGSQVEKEEKCDEKCGGKSWKYCINMMEIA